MTPAVKRVSAQLTDSHIGEIYRTVLAALSQNRDYRRSAQPQNGGLMETDSRRENEISRAVIEAAVEVQRVLGGPGLLESIYEEALAVELTMRGVAVSRQQGVPVKYKTVVLSTQLRLDLLVANCVVVECKAVTKFNPVFATQTLTYIRLTGLQLALIINFGQKPLRPGIRRVVNGLSDHERS
jgi:GxxExxY protein